MLRSSLPLSRRILGVASPERGPVVSVDLALVLAIDTSGSVSNDHMTLQIHGCAHAVQDPKVIAAVSTGRHGCIAVTFVEWSSKDRQNQVIGWSLIRDEPSARSFATKIMQADRSIPGGRDRLFCQAAQRKRLPRDKARHRHLGRWPGQRWSICHRGAS